MPKSKKAGKPQSFWMKTPVLVVVIIGLLLAPFFANYFYSNWSNKQLITGISEDFPKLIAEIELATGLNLEISSDCFQTTEKFSEGVNLCGIGIGETKENSPLSAIDMLIKKTEESNSFIKGREFINEKGYNFEYMNKDVCNVDYVETIYISCTIAPRSANEQLALEKLNADHLNQRKQFYKDQLQ